jgi:endonuclease YncB( thermonuclease family)
MVAVPAFAGEIIGIPRIIDGDTIEVNTIKIRLEAIDAPETDQPCLDQYRERWECGIEARERLKARAGDKLWRCHQNGTDQFRRVTGELRRRGDGYSTLARHERLGAVIRPA